MAASYWKGDNSTMTLLADKEVLEYNKWILKHHPGNNICGLQVNFWTEVVGFSEKQEARAMCGLKRGHEGPHVDNDFPTSAWVNKKIKVKIVFGEKV